MMVKDEKIPAYYRIWVTLNSRIRDKIYDPDEKLPSTKKLAEEFGVSDITIKKALAALVDEGFLERKRGVGTRIRKKQIHKLEMSITSSNFWDWYSYRNIIAKREGDVIAMEQVPYNRWLEMKLGIKKGGKLFCLKRVIKVMGEIVSYFVTYFFDTFLDPKFLENLDNQRFLKIAIDNWKSEIVTVKQEIRATIADIDLAGILNVGFGDPLFYVENIYFAKDGSVLALTQMYHRGDVYSYTGTTDFDKTVIGVTPTLTGQPKSGNE